MFHVKVFVRLKESVLDPQGQAVMHALHEMKFQDVKDVRIGKLIELKLDLKDRAQAEKEVQKFCSSLLTNPVIETYSYTLE